MESFGESYSCRDQDPVSLGRIQCTNVLPQHVANETAPSLNARTNDDSNDQSGSSEYLSAGSTMSEASFEDCSRSASRLRELTDEIPTSRPELHVESEHISPAKSLLGDSTSKPTSALALSRTVPPASKRKRRGRGQRKNEAFSNDQNKHETPDPFDYRECLFSDKKSGLRVSALANLETGLKVPGGLIMSFRYAMELGRSQDISQDFDDPCLRSISGHTTPMAGILRDVLFRLKGTSVTFRRDFLVCDVIDNIADVMFGASFIQEQFKLLLERVTSLRNTFTSWSSTKREDRVEKLERERRECEEQIKENERKLAQLKKEQARLEALRDQGKKAAVQRQ